MRYITTFAEPTWHAGYWEVRVITESVPSWWDRLLKRTGSTSVRVAQVLCMFRESPGLEWFWSPSHELVDRYGLSFPLHEHVREMLRAETMARIQAEQIQRVADAERVGKLCTPEKP